MLEELIVLVTVAREKLWHFCKAPKILFLTRACLTTVV